MVALSSSKTPNAVKEALVRRAQAVGFDSCRIAPCAPPRHAGEFRGWLRDGAAGEMDWMARGAEKRCDPDKILPGARSVVVVAMNYWQGKQPNESFGRIARYAWGDDYHDVMLRKLRELDSFLQEHGGVQK
ncbi:MAG: epoxyqueuosine reductase, partial [Chthoniobacterales bacterium]